MEYLRVHGVTVEIPPGLDDAERDAFCAAFVRETPDDLTDEEKPLHAELFLAQHTPKPKPAPVPHALEDLTVLQVRGVHLEVPPDLPDANRLALLEALMAEAPAGLSPTDAEAFAIAFAHRHAELLSVSAAPAPHEED